MAQSPNPGSSIQPLNVGNVVSAGIRLYSDHLKAYLGIAIVAIGWALIPFVVLIPIAVLAVPMISQNNPNVTSLWLIAPIWFIFMLFCSAKYLANSALISRLAFAELISQPTPIKEARTITNSRAWSFLWAAILTGILLFLALVALYILAAIVVAVPAGILFGVLGVSMERNPLVILLVGLLGLGVVAFLIIALCWLVARLFIVEVPLAIEDGLNATKTIGRSWDLTQGNAWRVFLISFIAFLITIPLQLLVQFASSTLQAVLIRFIEQDSPLFFSATFIAAYMLGLLSSVFVIPFWQSIKAVVYYDLRSRREGLGLQLRDRGSSF